VNTNNLEDRIGDNVFARDLPRWSSARSPRSPPKSNLSKVPTVGGRSVVAITFSVLADSQNAMNGLGTFSSASSASTPHACSSLANTSSKEVST
jgi:hypothetical protein